MAGFLSSTWAALDEPAKALLLLALSGALTAAGAMSEGRRDPVVRLGHLVWAAGSVTLAAAITMAATHVFPDHARLVLAVAGLSGAAHAGLRWRRHADAWSLLIATVGMGLVAAGPPGTALADGLGSLRLADVVRPLGGLLDPTLSSNRHLLTGSAHLLLAIATIAAARWLPTRTATTAKVLGTGLLWYAAAELNVLDIEVGAVAALLIVLAHLAHGLITDDTLMVVMGTLASLLAGVRVVTSLFSGEVVVTFTVLGAGIGMLAWAWRAAQSRAPARPGGPSEVTTTDDAIGNTAT